MQIIHPVTAETCRTYIGQPICAILLDGTQVFGTIDGVTETGLVFSQAYPGATILSTQPNKAKEQLSEIKDKARTSGFGFGSPFGGFGFGGGFRLLFPLIALLFLLPFFFI